MGKRLVTYIKDHSAQIRRIVIWAAVLLVTAVAAIVGAYYFDQATESRAFCGQLCHANGPEYVTQEVSPHADTECGICHIGPGLMPKVMAKIYGTGELYMQLANTFDRPVEHPVNRLRPADEICEQCHNAAQPYEDQIEQIAHFADDEANTETAIVMAMRIGGGDEQVGAHWHIDNPVSYVSPDEADRQDIPWVETVGDDGQTVVYQATEGALSATELEELPRRQLDCMDCHNRATHIFRDPADRVDEALASGEMDRALPYLKREAVKLLTASYPSQEEGVAAMEDLAQFYSSEYPDAYAERQVSVERAVETLQEIYQETVFPDMNVTWEVYPDNLGHQDFPGCFRCHDGSHVNEQGEAIPNNCTLCHSAPVVVETGANATDGAVFQGLLLASEKPASHLAASFSWDHRILANDTCSECHGKIEYGTDNSSFCANGICHGQDWPEPASVASFAHPVQLVGQHAQAACNECHRGTREPSLENCSTCHQPPSEPHFGTECAECHSPEGWAESVASWVASAPSNPHGLEAVDCLLCHNEGGSGPMPATHSGFPSEWCSRCHESTFVAQVPGIPHAIPEDGDGECLLCHSEGALQPTSSLHLEALPSTCLECHTSKPITDVPTIPHDVQGGGTCLICHGEDKTAPLPTEHAGWPGAACLLCHQAASSD